MTGPGSRRWLWLTAVVAGVLTVGALLATGLGGQRTLAATPLIERPAPEFALDGLDGRPDSGVRLSDLRGQVVVVNFWASWCTECHLEQEALNQTWQRFRDAGVVVVGVNFQDVADDARAYVASTGASYPVVVDADSSTALSYGLRGVPETYVIDRDGRIVDRVIGPVTVERLADRITGLLDEGAR